MEPNPICLNINWRTDEQQLQQWKDGQTGYPFIDAAMRQLIQVRSAAGRTGARAGRGLGAGSGFLRFEWCGAA